ncbi:MAG: phosphoribosylglycinamide formyltransferase [Armatimonadetes bacterium]|nr:phosphoribosylglycinamide formyltransferase [Armatimonadota bacterium]
MTRLAVLASGSGTTLQALLDAFPARGASAGAEDDPTRPGVTVAVVVVNTPGAPALDRGRGAGIPTVLVDHRRRSRESFEAELAGVIHEHRADLICLAGFLRILSPAFITRHAGRMLNVHPALLPAFGGQGMYGERVHREVLAARAAVSGCTIHLVDEVPDGGPILAQIAVPVLDGDTPAALAARVQAEERALYPQVIHWWADGRIRVEGSRVLLT